MRRSCNKCNKLRTVKEFSRSKKYPQICKYCVRAIKSRAKYLNKIDPKIEKLYTTLYWTTLLNKTNGDSVEARRYDALYFARTDNFKGNISRKKSEHKRCNLTEKYLTKLWSGKCAVTGLPIHFGRGSILAAEIDRIIPSKGYVKGNVQYVCQRINRVKNNIKPLEIINLIANFNDESPKYPVSSIYYRHDNKQRPTGCHDPIYSKMMTKNRTSENLFGVRGNLTVDYLKSIWTGKCPINGTDVYLDDGNASVHLDRIIPELGYNIGNVQFLSRRANLIKGNGTLQEFEVIKKKVRNL